MRKDSASKEVAFATDGVNVTNLSVAFLESFDTNTLSAEKPYLTIVPGAALFTGDASVY